MKRRIVVKKMIPDHVALGIDNWPREVREEISRVRGRRGYVPDEDMVICAIDGTIMGKSICQEQLLDCCRKNDDVILSVCSGEVGLNDEIGGAYPGNFTNDDFDNDRLDSPKKIEDYYSKLYPWLFNNNKVETVAKHQKPGITPKFSGSTRQTSSKKLRARVRNRTQKKEHANALTERQ